ncbi:MAG: ComEC/Rec2 family competence protein [Sphingomonas fennica]
MPTDASGPSIAFPRWPSAAAERWLEAERDQLALWLPVGLATGIGLWFLLPRPADWALLIVVALAIASGSVALPGGGRLPRAIALFALAVAIGGGTIWWRSVRVAAPVLDRPRVAIVTGRIERVEPRPAQAIVRLVVAGEGEALPPRLRLNVAAADVPAGLVTGARIRVRARLVPPPPALLPGAYDFRRIAWFQRLGATGRALDPPEVLAPPADPGWRGRLAGLRARLTQHILTALPGAEGGIAAALVTGDVGAIPDADAEAMRRSGLAHLLSISGLHVTAVVAATMALALRLLALSPALALRWPLPVVAAGAGALAGIGYTLLSGAEVPTIRSCIAALLVLAGLAMGREAVTLRLVAAGAVVVLLLWPEALVGASFQLSFAAVTAIVALHDHPRLRAAFARRAEPGWARLLRGLALLLLTGIAVEAVLAPIALFHFQRAGLYGALANIAAIPLTTFVIMPLEAAALLLDVAGLGGPLWWAAGLALRLLLALAHGVAALPGATAALPTMPLAAFLAMVAGGLWLLLWRTRLRLLGLAPFAAGAILALATPPPDLLVTADGRHLAVRTPAGGLALLRPRAGDYVRSAVGQAAGIEGEAAALDDWPAARCTADLCAIEIEGRRLLATRSAYLVDIRAIAAACARADLVVSERRLPRTCRPRWLKVDRSLLGEAGGLAIRMRAGTVRTALRPGDTHPWVRPPLVSAAPRRYPKPRNGTGDAG